MVSYDAHCHLSLAADAADMAQLQVSAECRYAVMATSHLDLPAIELLSAAHPDQITPFYGIHPWYSHLYSTTDLLKDDHYRLVLYPEPLQELLDALPEPVALLDHCETIDRLVSSSSPYALLTSKSPSVPVGIGEIGLDKLFRIPKNGYYGASSLSIDTPGSQLTPCRVSMAHQESVLRAMLVLAERHELTVLLHCVKAHGKLLQVVGDYRLKKVVLHSFSGPPEVIGQWNRALDSHTLALSFSRWINGADEEKLSGLLAKLEDHQILTETDMPIDRVSIAEHREHVDGIYEQLCRIRNWGPDEARIILEYNWSSLWDTY